jgi:hypothetical protein
MMVVVRLWILLSTVLVAAGWILSALHQLNRIGYAAVLLLTAIGLSWYWHSSKHPVKPVGARPWAPYFRRFRRPAPFLFLALSVMAFLGGALYVSLNPDTNSYRLPRILHWLWREQWHFIYTADNRLNIAGTGWEWLAAPLILFTKADRCVFLINLISYLLMPGLIFSLFRRSGVSGRVSWWWMWLLPTGWCYIFQAGGCTNDSFATIYALAAVVFALRAREKNSAADLWWSLLAVALVTGAKQTNIPLALLWFIPFCTCWKLISQRWGSAVLVSAFALLVSAVPVTVSNFIHYGNWMGMVPGQWKGVLTSPVWGLIGNAFVFPAQNLLPPFFPWSDSWNARMDRFVTTPFGSHFSSFEHFGMLSKNVHGVGEGNAGIGMAICLFLMLTVVVVLWRCRGHSTPAARPRDGVIWLLKYAPWGLLVLFLAKVGTYENARQFTPYYPFLFPSLLTIRGQALVTRRIWWQRLGIAMMLFAGFLLIISRGRPLFPAQTVFAWLKKEYPSSHLVARAAFAFDVRSAVGPRLRSWVENNLPVQETSVGLASVSSLIEPDLWFPYGHRAVERVGLDDTGPELRSKNLNFILVDGDFLTVLKMGADAWADKIGAEVVGEFKYQLMSGQPPEVIYLLRLRPPAPVAPA